jgi:hypothetical protein
MANIGGRPGGAITAFMPGASPPLVNTPIFLIMTTSELRNAKMKSVAGRRLATNLYCK